MTVLLVAALAAHVAVGSQALEDLQSKALEMELLMQSEHIREGLVIPTVIRVTKGETAFTSGTLEDVCCRTGEYVQAECYRYAVTGDREARANASRSAMALIRLEQVTGVPGAFARTCKRAAAPSVDEEAYFFPQEWHQSSSMPGYRWLGDPSVDQLNDWVIGLTLFYELAATPEERPTVKQAMSRVMGRILEHGMRIVDVDGKMTLWGNMSPALPHENLNALLALSDLLCAYRVTGEARFIEAYRGLIEKDRYAEQAVLAKVLVPEYAMNASDDNLGMEALDRLLSYEQDPRLRDLYLASLRRHWMALQYSHIPLYDVMVEVHIGSGLDSRSLDRLIDHTYKREHNVKQRRTEAGEVTIEGIWQNAPYEYLRTYWYGRYHKLLEKAAKLRDSGSPARPDPPVYRRPTIPPARVPDDLDAMVEVPGGEFIMGSEEGDPDERPVQRVYLPRFWIDKYLVTNSQFKLFDKSWTYPDGHDLRPAIVTWEQADAYARWAGKRLPTEAEWEKAARGNDGRRFPWGDNYDSTMVAWSNGEPQGRVTPCVSPYGCVDMVGNVWHWTADWYDAYPGSDFGNDAMGKHFKVLRGGASFGDRSHARCAHRYYALPDSKVVGHATGFRCIRYGGP